MPLAVHSLKMAFVYHWKAEGAFHNSKGIRRNSYCPFGTMKDVYWMLSSCIARQTQVATGTGLALWTIGRWMASSDLETSSMSSDMVNPQRLEISSLLSCSCFRPTLSLNFHACCIFLRPVSHRSGPLLAVREIYPWQLCHLSHGNRCKLSSFRPSLLPVQLDWYVLNLMAQLYLPKAMPEFVYRLLAILAERICTVSDWQARLFF